MLLHYTADHKTLAHRSKHIAGLSTVTDDVNRNTVTTELRRKFGIRFITGAEHYKISTDQFSSPLTSILTAFGVSSLA